MYSNLYLIRMKTNYLKYVKENIEKTQTRVVIQEKTHVKKKEVK